MNPMDMNATLKEIRIALVPVDSLAKSKAPTAKVRYAIGKLLGKMGKEYEAMDKQFALLREEFGTKDDAGNFSVAPESPKYKDFQAKVDEFLNTKVTLTGVGPVCIDDLPDAVEISSGDMLLMGPFLVDSRPETAVPPAAQTPALSVVPAPAGA